MTDVANDEFLALDRVEDQIGEWQLGKTRISEAPVVLAM
jgi:hypothetical protein